MTYSDFVLPEEEPKRKFIDQDIVQRQSTATPSAAVVLLLIEPHPDAWYESGG